MLLSTPVVAVLFRLINFGVLIGLAGYLFKKYMLGSVVEQIAERKKTMTGLRTTAHELGREAKLLDEMVKKEAEQCEVMQARILQWQVRIQQIQAARAQEKEERGILMQEQVRHKASHLAYDDIRRRVLPAAVQQAQDQLSKQFTADDRLGGQFVGNIVAFMQKSE